MPRTPALLEARGARLTLAAWAKQVGLPLYVLRARLRAGWEVEEALSRPCERTGPAATVQLTYNGVTGPLVVWARSAGLDPRLVRRRLKRGWDVRKALTTPG